MEIEWCICFIFIKICHKKDEGSLLDTHLYICLLLVNYTVHERNTEFSLCLDAILCKQVGTVDTLEPHCSLSTVTLNDEVALISLSPLVFVCS